MMRFPVGTSGETIMLTEVAIEHLICHRQTRWWQREAGGLLFARFDNQAIIIEEATGPRPTDRRTPFSYWPDRKAEQAEIDERFERGLHYVGDWHSHPQKVPKPSLRDERTMVSRVKYSRHQLNGILFAIIGHGPLPRGLALLLHDGATWHPLSPDIENVPPVEVESASETADGEQAGGIEA